jgi:putative ABC transport system substrate-binding protein
MIEQSKIENPKSKIAGRFRRTYSPGGSGDHVILTMRHAMAQALSLLTLLLLGFDQATGEHSKAAEIGWLSLGSSSTKDARFAGLLQGLGELGYAEGQNITVYRRYAEGKLNRLPELAGELVSLKVDAIVTGGVPQLSAAKQVTKTIPVIAAGAGDLVATGLVESLARPGGNVTGLTSVATDLPGKWVELLKETFPKINRVAVILNPDDKGPAAVLNELKRAAPLVPLQFETFPVRQVEDFALAVKNAGEGRATALVVLQSNLTNSHRKLIVEHARKHRLPTMFGESGLLDAGGLMSYGPNYVELYRRAATYVDKILKGAKPAELPVEQPTRFELVINLKAAKEIGVTIPPNVLARANKVIR